MSVLVRFRPEQISAVTDSAPEQWRPDRTHVLEQPLVILSVLILISHLYAWCNVWRQLLCDSSTAVFMADKIIENLRKEKNWISLCQARLVQGWVTVREFESHSHHLGI